MESMFRDAASFTGKGLESFNTAKVETMRQMFFGATSLERNGMTGWSIKSVKNMDYMVSEGTYFVWFVDDCIFIWLLHASLVFGVSNLQR